MSAPYQTAVINGVLYYMTPDGRYSRTPPGWGPQVGMQVDWSGQQAIRPGPLPPAPRPIPPQTPAPPTGPFTPGPLPPQPRPIPPQTPVRGKGGGIPITPGPLPPPPRPIQPQTPVRARTVQPRITRGMLPGQGPSFSDWPN